MSQTHTPRNFFVGLCGNIGVGKSLFAELLGKRLGLEIYYEPVSQNPYLEKFYADMRRWAFHLQIYFLAERFKAQKQMNQSGVPFIQDRTIYEDAEIFARVLHERGEMDRQDFGSYLALFRELVDFLPMPSLLIYLKASPETLLRRIADRGRSCEKSISSEYLGQLAAAYDAWLPRVQETCPTFILETEGLTYPPTEDALELVAERIRQQAAACGAALPQQTSAGS